MRGMRASYSLEPTRCRESVRIRMRIRKSKLATNSKRPRRFDLRTTIPLATETLVHLAKQPKRSWAIPALTLIVGFAFMILMLELLVFPGPVSALAFGGELRSRLSANYGVDPIVARIHELRLTIVEDVLGMDGGSGSNAPAIALMMEEPGTYGYAEGYLDIQPNFPAIRLPGANRYSDRHSDGDPLARPQ